MYSPFNILIYLDDDSRGPKHVAVWIFH